MLKNYVYFKLKEHIRAAFYNEQIIVLDLLKDNYIIIAPPMTDSFEILLKQDFIKKNGKYECKSVTKKMPDINDHIKELLKAEIIEIFNKKVNQTLAKTTSSGMNNIDWRESFKSTETPSFWQCLQAYYYLVKVHRLVKKKKFIGLTDAVAKAAAKFKSSEYSLNTLILAMNKAAKFYFHRVKCLEWATALTLYALKKGIMVDLVVGVQNIPFMAHAWVEHKNRIIADDENLPNNLAVLLKEPNVYKIGNHR